MFDFFIHLSMYLYVIFTNYLFLYPVIMTIIGIVFSILFYIFSERNRHLYTDDHFKHLTDTPLISILIPCYNEEDTIFESTKSLFDMSYQNIEIILIDDKSTDNTLFELNQLKILSPHVKIISLETNQGKANALNRGLEHAQGEFILGIDADAMLTPTTIHYLLETIQTDTRLGAVTGSPRVRNRTSLLGKLQLLEYATIIGLLKRSQLVLGKIMTISGVIVLFRKKALLDIGGWDTEIITEDIDVTWKLYQHRWKVNFEPRAHCWILVPEKLLGLIKQRKRWAQGGLEVVRKNIDLLFSLKHGFAIKFLLLEQMASVIWSLILLFSFFALFATNNAFFTLLTFTAFVLSLLAAVQLTIAFALETRYERNIWKYFIYLPIFVIFYWTVNFTSLILALPKLFSREKKFAIWSSPDRGL